MARAGMILNHPGMETRRAISGPLAAWWVTMEGDCMLVPKMEYSNFMSIFPTGSSSHESRWDDSLSMIIYHHREESSSSTYYHDGIWILICIFVQVLSLIPTGGVGFQSHVRIFGSELLILSWLNQTSELQLRWTLFILKTHPHRSYWYKQVKSSFSPSRCCIVKSIRQ